MTDKRVVFDGYWLSSGPPSGRNVVHSLIVGWRHAFPNDRVTVALPTQPRVAIPEGVEIVVSPSRITNHAAWINLKLPKIARLSDVTITQNFAPLRSVGPSTVVTFVHDAIVADHPEWFTPAERVYLRAAAGTLRRADAVVTSSRAEADRISRSFVQAKRKVVPIGLAVPVGLSGAKSRQPTSAAPSGGFLLTVGRLNVRKNLSSLIDAFVESGVAAEMKLLVVGSANGRSNSSTENERHPSVKFLGAVSDSELRWLYEHCSAFVFPSLDEGFGLPLLEANYFGAKSIASAIPAFEEIGVAETLFDPTSVPAMIDAVRSTPRARDLTPASSAQFDNRWLDVAARLREASHLGIGAGIV